jgi:hypothetical protein
MAQNDSHKRHSERVAQYRHKDAPSAMPRELSKLTVSATCVCARIVGLDNFVESVWMLTGTGSLGWSPRPTRGRLCCGTMWSKAETRTDGLVRIARFVLAARPKRETDQADFSEELSRRRSGRGWPRRANSFASKVLTMGRSPQGQGLPSWPTSRCFSSASIF